MNFEEFFRDFWWLMFPIFGMFLVLTGTFKDEQRANKAMDMIKSYVDQGKEPPPDLLRLAGVEETSKQPQSRNSGAWTFIVFTALAGGFGAGWYLLVRGGDNDVAFAFATVTVTMAVLALGALALLIFGRRS
jgi:hypothetical protein